MKDKFPKIFKTKIDNIKSKIQTEYYYRSENEDKKDNNTKIADFAEKKSDGITLLNKINDIFKRPDFVYQSDITIMYKNGESINQKIVGFKENYLLTIDGEKIYISDIYDIK